MLVHVQTALALRAGRSEAVAVGNEHIQVTVLIRIGAFDALGPEGRARKGRYLLELLSGYWSRA
jgi:hypothetical protein